LGLDMLDLLQSWDVMSGLTTSVTHCNDHPYLILLASFIIYAWWLNFHRCSCSPLRYFFHCSNLRSLRSSSRQGFPVSIHRDAGDRTNQTGKMAVPPSRHPLIWV
jgi:hypothetical protein